MENLERERIMALEALKQQLANAGIDTSQWGAKGTKTIEHLLAEIEHGETILVTGEQGELLRKVVVGGADIYYTSPEGKKYRLKEEKQVFKNGQERRRDLGQAVSEKMKVNENPEGAMVRGVREELGIEGEITLTKTGADEESFPSPSYPGLQSQSLHHKFGVTLNDQQFRSEGYVEEQADKSTYFVWEEVKEEMVQAEETLSSPSQN